MKKFSLVVVLLCITALATSLFAEADDARIRALESRIQALEGTNVTRGTNIASAVSRAEAVQTEFAAVKGAVDSNSHRITALNNQLQSSSGALERRIQSIEEQIRLMQGMLRKNLGDSSSPVASDVCECVLPIIPNLYGFVTSSPLILRPNIRADRAYSYWSMSSVLASLRSRFPLSQFS